MRPRDAAPITWPRYNQVQQKSIHNAYDRDEAPFDQIVWGRAHSVEFDVHASRRGFPRVDGDFYVYHVDALAMNHTSCTKLSDCLSEMRALQLAYPKHDVITVVLDVKDDFSAGHTREDLDGRVLAHLDRDWIVTPNDLVSACPGARTLQDAVRGECGWPRLDALRGKFMVIITGGGCEPSSHVAHYVDGASALDRVGFAAPEVTGACPVGGYVASAPDVAFVNMSTSHMASATVAEEVGLVARVYGLDDESSWKEARARRAQILATNKVNFVVDPWATTHNARGWPFACLGECSPDLEEDVHAMGLVAASGDLDGARDGFYFASREESATAVTWSANIAVEGSHVNPRARACLMARESEDADAPYFALCRAAAEYPLRAQWRTSRGGPTEVRESSLVLPDTLSHESTFFARIALRVDHGGTDAVAEGSIDGATWSVIHRETIPAALVRHGLAASAHGAGPMRFVFGGVTRVRAGEAESRVAAADLSGRAVGRCDGGLVFDGFFP